MTPACTGNLWEWYGQVDELVRLIFFAIILTWASGIRGAECDHLQFEIQDNGERNLYILNGLVTIVTTYVKTRSFRGHGDLIARTIPWQLGRLVLLVYSVIFPAASYLATYAFDRNAAEAYLSYMFVLSGKIMKSEDFSKVIATQTSKHFDISMGLRQFRQTMKSILTNLAGIDFGDMDAEDSNLAEINHLFGHGSRTGEKHYALQSSDALPEISHTSIASSQRISLMWHAAIHLQHPKASKMDDCNVSHKFNVMVATLQVTLLLDQRPVEPIRPNKSCATVGDCHRNRHQTLKCRNAGTNVNNVH